MPLSDTTATSAQLRQIVKGYYEDMGCNYALTARVCGCSPALVWKLLNGFQDDSPKIRKQLEIGRPKRPRVWMRTDDLQLAVDQLCKHYPVKCVVMDDNSVICCDRSDE